MSAGTWKAAATAISAAWATWACGRLCVGYRESNNDISLFEDLVKNLLVIIKDGKL